MIKVMRVALPEHIHFQLKERCKFYDITIQEVTSSLLMRFIEGEFDKDFNIVPLDFTGE